MIEVSYRRLKMLVPNALSKLFGSAQNLYVGYSQVQRNTFLRHLLRGILPRKNAVSKSDLRVLTLTVPNMISLRASCYQSHLRKKLGIHSIKRLLLLKLARCINYIMIGNSALKRAAPLTSIPFPVKLRLTGKGIESSPPRYPAPLRQGLRVGTPAMALLNPSI